MTSARDKQAHGEINKTVLEFERAEFQEMGHGWILNEDDMTVCDKQKPQKVWRQWSMPLYSPWRGRIDDVDLELRQSDAGDIEVMAGGEWVNLK